MSTAFVLKVPIWKRKRKRYWSNFFSSSPSRSYENHLHTKLHREEKKGFHSNQFL